MLAAKSMIPFPMQEEWVAQSIAIAAITKSKLEASGSTTKRFDAKTDSYGWLGERVFYEFLKRYEILFRNVDWKNQIGESFEACDFKIGETTFDVKSALPKNSLAQVVDKIPRWSYLYPASQAPKAKDFIVLIYLWPQQLKALIVGIIEGEEVAKIPTYIESVAYADQRFEIPNHKIEPITAKFNDLDSTLLRLSGSTNFQL